MENKKASDAGWILLSTVGSIVSLDGLVEVCLNAFYLSLGHFPSIYIC